MEVLSPSEIRYSQDSILNKFSNGIPLTSTFACLLSGQLSVSSLPAMQCIQKDGSWYAVSGNRRLFVYKRLQDAGVLSTVTVSRTHAYDASRFTTKCSGLYVRIRGYGLEAGMQQIVTEWKRGEDVVGKWKVNVAAASFSSYQGGSSRYGDSDDDDDSDCDDFLGGHDSDYDYCYDSDPYNW